MVIQACAEKGFCTSLQVVIEEYPPVLWIKVETYEPTSKAEKHYYKDFRGDEYDKALEYFRRHTLDLKREYCPEYQEENA